MRGKFTGVYPLPPTSDGFIKDGRFTYAGNDVVYAVRQFRGPVQSMGATGRWRRVREGDVETTMTMAITPNDNIISDMVHFSVNRSTWKLTTRRDSGNFDPIAVGEFSPILTLDHDYEFELQIGDGEVTLKLPDGQVVTRKADVTGLVGDRAFWEQYPTTIPADVVFDYDKVWAAEAGQPLQPVA